MQQNAWNQYEECREELTRVELRNLRNAGNLELDCVYAITDYNRRWCLDWKVEFIEMRADSVNSLSMEVNVDTNMDNVHWVGRYDIDTNRIVELKDNRGNHANGRLWNEVDAMPWGNSRWTEVHIINADVNVNCETELTVTNTRFETDSFTNLLDATGSIVQSEFTTNADVRWNGSVIDIDDCKFTTSANVDGANATLVKYLDCTVSNNGTDQYNGAGNVERRYTVIDGWYVYVTWGTRNYLYQTEIAPRATVRQFSGEMLIYYSSLDSYAEIRNEAGAAAFYAYYSHYDSRAYIRNYNTARIRHYAVNVNSRWEIRHRDGSNQNLYYSNIRGYSILTMSGTVTTVYSMDMSSFARVNLSGWTHYYDHFYSYPIFNTAFNTRSVYAVWRITTTATAANTNKWRDYFNNNIV